MNRAQLVEYIKKAEHERVSAGAEPDLQLLDTLKFMNAETLRQLAYVLMAARPAVKNTQKHFINEEGEVVALPNSEMKKQEEAKRAAEAPSIEELAREDRAEKKVIPAAPVDPTTTVEWRVNVRRSENLAGRIKSTPLSQLNILSPATPPDYEENNFPGLGSAIHSDPTQDGTIRVAPQTNIQSSELGSGFGILSFFFVCFLLFAFCGSLQKKKPIGKKQRRNDHNGDQSS